MRREELSLVGLLETRIKAKHFHKVFTACFSKWKFLNNYYYALNGRIWVLWDPQRVEVKFLGASDQVIHYEIKSSSNDFQAIVSFIYAQNSKAFRRKLWDEILDFQKKTNEEAWLILGDFNCFLKLDEREGYEVIAVEPCEDLK